MNSIWLHRISHHADVTYPLLSKGYLSIGFSDFTDQEYFVDNVLASGMPVIDDACRVYWPEHPNPRTRHNLRRFIFEMKTGDIVVVPHSWGTFSVYELISDKPQAVNSINTTNLLDWNEQPLTIGTDNLLHRTNPAVIDLGFVWQVKPIRCEISRDKFADAALTARMKIRTTNAQINDLRLSVEEALRGAEINQPINLHTYLTEAAIPTVLQSLHKHLNPKKFEKLIAWYFRRIGASNVFMPAGSIQDKEGDADVIATFEPIKLIIYVQAKFHQGETSTWALEQVQAYKEYKSEIDAGYSQLCWVITTADKYSNAAILLAREQNVQLIDGKKFAGLLLEAGLNGLDEALDN